MEIPTELRCLFSAPIEKKASSYVVEIPAQELTRGDLSQGEVYRIAVLATDTEASDPADDIGREPTQEQRTRGPPVAEGDRREVEIEDIGEQGDGIARVERGFVIVVPDTEQGDRVTIEIRNVQENVAFGTVVERQTSVSDRQ